MKKTFLAIMLACLFLPANAGDATYTAGSDVLFGRSQALGNELAHILINAGQQNNSEMVNILKTENQYLKERIVWLESLVDKKLGDIAD